MRFASFEGRDIARQVRKLKLSPKGIILAGLLLGSSTVPPAATAAAGATKCYGVKVTIHGTEGNDVLRGTKRDDVIAGLGGDDRLLGRGGSDTLCGGPGDDFLNGGAGIDWVMPAGGSDFASGGKDEINVLSYGRSPSAVRVNLDRNVARGWGRDVVRNVHQVEGSRFGDTIIGDSGGNALTGSRGDDSLKGLGGEDSLIPGPGSDLLVGGRSRDYAVFIFSEDAVEVNLAAGTVTGEGDDRLRGLESVFGSPDNDVLTGNRHANEFIGGIDGDDAIVGRGGDDVVFRYYGAATIAAGTGRDKVFYAFPGTIDLAAGTAVGTDFSDSLMSVEDVAGGGGPHVIGGNDERNHLEGGGGRDVISGRAADDVIAGNGGDDLLDGGDGTDEIDGGGGEDACVEGESIASCERTILAAESRSTALTVRSKSVASWEWTFGPTVPHLVSR